MNASTTTGVSLRCAAVLALLIVIAAGPACRAPSRAQVDERALSDKQLEYLRSAEQAELEATRRLVHRLKRRLDDYQQGRATSPPVLEILIISGGGDLGAFGAGFLQGWGSTTDPRFPRPQFDAVTGVSTGALIAPFAFLGDEDSYARAAKLYSNPKPDWVTRRGFLFFLPHNESLVRIDGLKRDIRAEFDKEFVARVAAEASTGRVLAIGTTNLDFGRQRAWDLGSQAHACLARGSMDQFVSILLASSAVPGAFPPVKIGPYLYADGAISTNILYNASLRSSSGLAAVWAAEYPGVRMPLARFWVVINSQLDPVPQITQLRWVDVTRIALAIAVREATSTSLQNLSAQLELLNAGGTARTELRYVSIPDDWRAGSAARFDAATMRSLAELGMRMGRDPASWRTRVPPEHPPSAAAKISSGKVAGLE